MGHLKRLIRFKKVKNKYYKGFKDNISFEGRHRFKKKKFF